MAEARLNLVITARDEAKSVIENFAAGIKETFAGLQEELSRAFNMSEIVSTIGEAMDTIKRDISEVSMGNALEEQFNTLNKSVEETAKVVEESFNQMVQSASKAGEEMSRAFNMSTLETAVSEAMATIEKDVSEVNISTSLEEQFRQMVTAVDESTNEIRNIVATLDSGFNNLISSSEKTTEAVSLGFETMSRNITESTDQMVQALDNAGQSSKHLDESLDFMNLQMAGEMIKQVGEQITGFFEHAVSSAADFDQNIVNTTASLDANMGVVKLNTQQIKAMQDAAISMGESGFFSANQVADAMNTMSKQGISYQQIMSGGIQTVYKVAAANQADLESTANVVSDIYNEMGDMFKAAGMSAQQASQLIGNSMTVALHHARISMEDFMTTMKYVGPQAAAMGVGIKDVSATIALLGQHGIRASQAGTTIRRMLTNLTPASKAAAAEMKDLGMITKDGSNIFYDAAGKMKPLAEVQQLLHDKLAALNPEQQQFAIKTIFGQYALSGMTAIVNTAPSKYKALTDAMNNNNVMTDIMNEKSKGLGMEIQRLNAHWQTVQKTIGEALKPMVESLISDLNNLMKGWEGLNPGVKQAIIVFTAISGVVLVLGGSLLALVGTVGMFANAWESGIKVFSFFISPMGLTVAAIIAAVAIIGVAAYELYKHWDQVKAWLIGIWNAIATTATSVFNNVKSFLSSTFTSIVSTATSTWNNFSNGIRNIWNSVVSWIKGAAQAFANAIVEAFQWMYNHNYYFKDLVDFIRNAWTSIQNNTRAAWSAITSALTNAWNTMSSTAHSVWSAISSFLTSLWNSIVSTARSLWSGLSSFLSSLWHSISSAVSSAWNAIASTMSSKTNQAISAVKGPFQSLGSFFSGLASMAVQWGSNIVNSIANGIRSAAGAVGNAIKSVAGGVASFLGFHDIPGVAAHATGGIFNKPHLGLVAEDGPEAIIPLSNPTRGLELWKKAGQMLGGFESIPSMAKSISVTPQVGRTTNPTIININIDGRSAKTDNDLAEVIAHKIYRQMPVVS